MPKQKIIVMNTDQPDMRSSANGWSAEDSNFYVFGKPVGNTPGASFRYDYENPLHAMAHGWRLMAPPYEIDHGPGYAISFEWYFEKFE